MQIVEDLASVPRWWELEDVAKGGSQTNGGRSGGKREREIGEGLRLSSAKKRG